MDQVRDVLFRGPPPPVTGAGVTVAVLDTGVDVGHPDLSGALDVDRARSFLWLDSRLLDPNGHGTHVAGIIAGDGVASDGKYRGVAPGVTIISVRVMEMRGVGEADTIVRGIEYSLGCGADIINYSASRRVWRLAGGPPPWKWPAKLSAVDRAMVHAAERGVLCIAAAGNDGPAPGSVARPGSLHPLLCVGATDRSGKVAEGSSRGPAYVDPQLHRGRVVARADPKDPSENLVREKAKPDVVAPGGDFPIGHPGQVADVLGAPGGIVSTRSSEAAHLPRARDPSDATEPYTRMGGTSQAAAVVSGIAALGLEYCREVGLDPGANPGSAMKKLILASASALEAGGPEDFGHGQVTWFKLRALIEDCAHDENRRRIVLDGKPALWMTE